MSHRPEPKTYKLTGIDGKTTGATTIFTTENNGQRFYPTLIMVEITTANNITIAGVVSLGTNSSTYNNLLAAGTLGTVVNSVLPVILAALYGSIAANTAVKINVTTGATATTCTLTVTVQGFYQ